MLSSLGTLKPCFVTFTVLGGLGIVVVGFHEEHQLDRQREKRRAPYQKSRGPGTGERRDPHGDEPLQRGHAGVSSRGK